MPKKELSHQFILSLAPPNRAISFYDEIESGLILRLSKAGSKSFSYRYHIHGQQRRFKIGSFPEMSLGDARAKVRSIKAEIDKGNDPQRNRNQRRAKAEPKKFEDLAEKFKKRHLPNLSSSTQKTYTERIDGIMMPALKGIYIEDIKRDIIIDLLEEIAYERESPIQSNRIRAILSSMFTFAVKHGMAPHNPVKSTRPLGKEVSRDRVLSRAELRAMWSEFNLLPEPTGQLFKVLLLLGQRKGETSRMRWKNITDSIWAIPKEDTKAARAHYVPLPTLAEEIIESLKNDCPYIFESKKNPNHPIRQTHETFKRAAERAGVPNIRIHDLRRTAATYMAEGGTDRTVLGKVLNHKGLAGDNQVTARYDRYSYIDEKRTALNRWSQKLQQIIEGAETKIHKLG